ncbi:MAG: NfeD family protein [Oscillospiraceae bacterium]|nr:NfeD family protein [Oscillospiraceae bacterium]
MNVNNLFWVWIALAVIFGVVEAATAQIVTIWFAVGSVGALIANVVGAGTTIQLVVFVAVSILTLIIARPYLKKFTRTEMQRTNADRCIGETAIVTEEINNTQGTGQVKVGGNIWTARSLDSAIIPADEKVIVEKIEGVKLIVSEKVKAESK